MSGGRRDLDKALTSLVKGLAKDASEGGRADRLPSEFYFTDRLVLGLSRLPRTFVVPTPGYEEARKGSDLEIWLWLKPNWHYRLAVQAKKLSSDGRYDGLNYKKGKQFRDLERYALARKAASVYLLYNHDVSSGGRVKWHCPSCSPKKKEQEELWGVSLVPSWRVKQALKKHGSRNFPYLHEPESAISLRCLIHGYGKTGGKVALHNRPSGSEDKKYFGEWPGKPVRTHSHEDMLRQAPPTELRPKYVVALGLPENLQDGWFEEAVAHQFPGELPEG